MVWYFTVVHELPWIKFYNNKKIDIFFYLIDEMLDYPSYPSSAQVFTKIDMKNTY